MEPKMDVQRDVRIGRTARSARLPQATLIDALTVTRALVDLAGPATRARIAQQAGASVTSGVFRERIAAAQYFGFVDKSGERYEATARGIAALGDEVDARLTALRDAALSSGFGVILERFASREATERAVGIRLQEDFDVPEKSAPRIAKILLETAQQAELVSAGRFDAAAIEEARDRVGEADLTLRPGLATTKQRVRPAAPTTEAASDPQPKNTRPVEDSPTAPIEITIHLDVSGLGVDEIVRLISEVRK